MDLQTFQRFCHQELIESLRVMHDERDQERVQAAQQAAQELKAALGVLAVYRATFTIH